MCSAMSSSRCYSSRALWLLTVVFHCPAEEVMRQQPQRVQQQLSELTQQLQVVQARATSKEASSRKYKEVVRAFKVGQTDRGRGTGEAVALSALHPNGMGTVLQLRHAAIVALHWPCTCVVLLHTRGSQTFSGMQAPHHLTTACNTRACTHAA